MDRSGLYEGLGTGFRGRFMGSIEALLGVWAAGLTLMVLGLPKP